VLFVKRLTALDTGERDQLMRQLQEERMAKRRTEESEMKLRFTYNLMLAEIDALRTEIEELKRGIRHEQRELWDFRLQQVVPLNDKISSARLVEYDPQGKQYIVAGAGSNSHGICKVSVLDSWQTLWVPLHQQLIKAMSINSESLLLTTSFDRTLKLSSLHNNNVLLSYGLPCPGWSCGFDKDNSERCWAGLANGSVQLFDIRMTRGPLAQGKVSSTPIHAIASLGGDKLGISSLDGLRILKIAHLNEAEETVSFVDAYANRIPSCCPFAFDDSVLAMASKGCPGRFAVGRLSCDENSSKMEWKVMYEGKSHHPVTSFVRPSLLSLPSEDLAVFPDRTELRLVKIKRDTGDREERKLLVDSNCIVDCCFARSIDSLQLAVLAERQLSIFS